MTFKIRDTTKVNLGTVKKDALCLDALRERLVRLAFGGLCVGFKTGPNGEQPDSIGDRDDGGEWDE